MKNLERFGPVLLVVISVGVAGYFVYVATARALTGLEGVLLQVIALATGLVGSFIFGRRSAHEAAREIIKPHARSAFRRLRSLYLSLSQVADAIESSHDFESREDYQMILAKLEAFVFDQLVTADDALEDWRDVVPEDVEGLRRSLSPDSTMRDRP